MNDLQKIYCEGASMAYLDCAEKMYGMITKAPAELKGMLECLIPLADAMKARAGEVHAEAERYGTAERH